MSQSVPSFLSCPFTEELSKVITTPSIPSKRALKDISFVLWNPVQEVLASKEAVSFEFLNPEVVISGENWNSH